MSKKNTTTAQVTTEAAKPTGLKGWVKPPMTVREDGLTYSLCSRVYNALSRDIAGEFEAGKDAVPMTDGRGVVQQVSPKLIAIAASLGAPLLKSVKSAYLRPRMVVDLKALTVSLKELEKKVPAKKEEAPKAEEKAEKIA